MNDKVLIIGSGGREHAFAWKIAQSKYVEKVYVAPGNDGMNDQNKIITVDISENDFAKIAEFARLHQIALVIIGPEKPLSQGIVDYLENQDIRVIGPKQEAAKLESSKIFAKKFMIDHHIPTADFEFYDNYEIALEALSHWEIETKGIVIKADELASGKGVVVTHDRKEAQKTLYDFMMNPHCSINAKNILLEEKLEGREVSFFALSDGENFVSLGHACDYKRLYDNNLGPNTGGMGGFTPENFPNRDMIFEIEQNVFEKTIMGMYKAKIPFKGFLFAGLMIKNNQIKVLEYNVRFGDPEAQILLPTISEDIYPLLKNASETKLSNNYYFRDNKLKSVHVTFASGGYPSNYNKPMQLNEQIHISSELQDQAGTHLFYSGVKKINDRFVNTGGRVLGITCVGPDIQTARTNCYKCVEKIRFNHAQWRNDIAIN